MCGWHRVGRSSDGGESELVASCGVSEDIVESDMVRSYVSADWEEKEDGKIILESWVVGILIQRI